MKVAIGCDHGGINLKPLLIDYLEKKGIEYVDYGCHDKTSVDYNEYALKVSNAVANGECDKGVLICGTGIGMSIVANKVKGIRCSLCSDSYSAKMTRAHNDSNMLAMGARVIGIEVAKEIVAAWLDTPFEGGRHQVRVDMITAIENGEVIE